MVSDHTTCFCLEATARVVMLHALLLIMYFEVGTVWRLGHTPKDYFILSACVSLIWCVTDYLFCLRFKFSLFLLGLGLLIDDATSFRTAASSTSISNIFCKSN
jgi:hypothetical protein